MARAMAQSTWLRAIKVAIACGTLAVAGLPAGPAAAQFGWFGNSGATAQDAYDTIAEHGFRLTAPLMQTRDVFIADVIDRRMHRQRLIISRESGQIVQRFAVRGPGSPDAPFVQPRPQGGGNLFDRIVRGFDDDPAPRPPGYVGDPSRNDAVSPQALPKPQRLAKPPRPSDIDPRLATRHDEPPVSSRPLTPEPVPASPPSAAAPDKPVPTATAPSEPATTTAPAAAPSPAPSVPPARATVITSDPLRIPGTRDEAAKPATAATASAAAAKTAPAAKPAMPARPTGDVPVAPLD